MYWLNTKDIDIGQFYLKILEIKSYSENHE